MDRNIMHISIPPPKPLTVTSNTVIHDCIGTGYASLTCLQHFPVDVLKLDHIFICNIEKDEDTGRLAAGIISIARDLRLKVVAEGAW